MSESSDTSIIDDKKTESTTSNNGNYVSNIGSFLLTVFIIFLIIVVYYASSGLVLYACKLAQSNILPTDIHCFPYTETKPDIQPIQTNIFTTFTEPQLSMKMSFPYNEYNSSNKILDMFREYKNKSSSNFLANYFISIMESLIHFNYSAINTILNMLNGLPEVLLIIFGPIIVGFLSTIIFIVDHLYIIYLWFSNMGWFFKTNSNNSGTGEPKWEDVQITEPINLGSGKGYSIKEVVDMIVKHSNKDLEVKWLTDKPAGDAIRLFDMTRAKSHGFDISVSLEEGIKKTTEWFLNNKEILDKRYNAFVNH